MPTSKQETSGKSSSPRRQSFQNQVENKAAGALPRWALAMCAIMMALSLSIRQMGLDISSPLNRMMTAHAVRIEKSATNPLDMSDEVEQLLEHIKVTERRLRKLERWAHQPNGDDVPD